MSITKKSTTTRVQSGTQSFFLESEIRLSGMGLWSTLLGLCVLLILKFLLPAPARNMPSLAVLIAIGIAVTVFYLGIRFVALGVIRWKVTQKFPVKNLSLRSIQGGELPRNWFLLALVVPTISLVPLCCGLLAMGIGLGHEMWIVICVGAAQSLRDLIGAVHVLFVDPARWIKETSVGLDVLEPVGEP